MLQEWPLVEFDFTHLLHIDLDRDRHTLTWRRFTTLLAGLFAVEKSLVRVRFAPDKTPEEGQQHE